MLTKRNNGDYRKPAYKNRHHIKDRFDLIVCPFHRKNDRHLFSGEGVIIKWDLQGKNNQVNVYSKKLKTWDSFWRKVLPIFNISQATFPAVVSILGCSEIANTAIVKLEKVSENEQLEETRLILTADAGRYWEVDPVSPDTITPIGPIPGPPPPWGIQKVLWRFK